MSLVEYTINQSTADIREDIVARRPTAIGFSCYLWNIRLVLELAADLKLLLPDTEIFLGGPEVSYETPDFFAHHPFIDFILTGEGELAFARYCAGVVPAQLPGALTSAGLTPAQPPVPLDAIPFVYDGLTGLEHKMLYYETQRGCPFSCQYCLSSATAGVRFLSWERVQADLSFFLAHRAPRVKLVDRTFNANRAHARRIWAFLMAHDNGVTNFHMELEAGLLTEDDLALLAQARPGLFQFEIGVQSTHEPTLAAVHRPNDFPRLAPRVQQLRSQDNIHLHLDLIAGLPFEDYATFGRSFDDVFALRPHQLQLGFLKLLKGSGLRARAQDLGLVFSPTPPYQILKTPQLSYGDLCRLQALEDGLETYYNSGKARLILDAAVPCFSGAFALFEALGDYRRSKVLLHQTRSKAGLYRDLWDFFTAQPQTQGALETLRGLLAEDMLRQDRLPELPDWLGLPELSEPTRRSFFQDDKRIQKYAPQLLPLSPARRARACRLLARPQGPVLLFDYTTPGHTRVIPLEEPLP